jgi:hypothetical protein
MRRLDAFGFRCLLAGLSLAASSAAIAWGPNGHRAVGAIADHLIAGSNAAKQVEAILGGLSLEQAAVWADCARGVAPGKNYVYAAAGQYPECAIFETATGEAEMSDFVRRNDSNCMRKPTEESCHKQYHYADVAIQRERYGAEDVGARNDDIVAAAEAAARVLSGEPSPPPFNIKGKREALLLLAHYVGDIHQPLHVGAVYLDAAGRPVDPDLHGFDPATATRGGNLIVVVDAATGKRDRNLHQAWDEVPATITAARVDSAWLASARAVPPSSGAWSGWPALWASDTLARDRSALASLHYGPRSDGDWTVSLSAPYKRSMSAIKRKQLTKAGARLAQILEAIWPQ